MPVPIPPTSAPPDSRHRRTVAWVVGLGTAGLVFDGYDLVVYGAVVPGLLRDPSQIGPVTPQLAGILGSFALVGVMVGALTAGAISDLVGRRKVLLTGYAWLSIGMVVTALSSSTAMFGVTRFLTGLGMGALLAATAPLVAEVVPRDRRNFYTGITFSGVALGALLTALVAILLLGQLGWRGMFLLGALPLVTLLPLAWFRMPESVAWLVARGRIDEARAVSARTGIPMPEVGAPPAAGATDAPRERVGFAGLFGRALLLPTVLLGLITVAAQIVVFSLNTWLPELMQRAGFPQNGSLAFLLVLNGGGVVGALLGARLADRYGSARSVVALTLMVGVVSATLLTLDLPAAVLIVLVGTVGFGIGGGNLLVYTFTANYYRTPVRGAGVAWVTGVGRLGAVVGPLLGGLLLGAGQPLDTIFLVLAALALVATVLTLMIPPAAEDVPDTHRAPVAVFGAAPAAETP